MIADVPAFDMRRAVLATLRLACILSLWHAPVPWMHIHSDDDVDLASHLRHFHSEPSTVPHEESLGWHWHLALPLWGQTPSSMSEEDEPSPCAKIHLDPVIVVAAMSWHVDVDIAVWNSMQRPKILPRWPQIVGSVDEFLGIDLRRRSEQQILSVCLC